MISKDTAIAIASISGAAATMLGTAWYVGRWVFSPHVKDTIRGTITETIGARLDEVPKLTIAVDRLTGVIERQTTDTKELSDSMGELGVKVDSLKGDVRELWTRTEAIEKTLGRPDGLPVEQPRRRRRKAS